jgi:hypothetical protein
MGAGVLAIGLAAGVEDAGAAGSFPPVMELRRLHPGFGGDGSAGVVVTGVSALDYSAWEVSGAGDVNGDGVGDLLIGAPEGDPDGRHAAGESYVVFGHATGFPAAFPLRSLLPARGGDGSRGFILEGIDEYDHVGAAVSNAGDVNGDGVDDVIIGAADAESGFDDRLNVGECYVVFGRSTGFPPAFELRSLRPAAGGDGSEGFVLNGIADRDNAGVSVSGAGDVNGDGIDDLLIGAYTAGAWQITPGQSYVVFGRTTGFPPLFELRRLRPDGGGDGSEGFAIQGIDGEDLSGRAVSSAGDVNGDGVDDVLIGAPNAQANTGEGYVVFGRASGFPPMVLLRDLLPENGGDGSAGFILRGADGFDFAGDSVSDAGDVNGDGIDDLLIGATSADPGGEEGAGESYLVFGRASLFQPIFELRTLHPAQGGDGTAGVIFTGRYDGDGSGISVSGAGDVNGDGLADLVIGAFGADPRGQAGAGESYVVFGRATRFPALFELRHLAPAQGGDGSEGFIIVGARANDASGYSVSDTADVNGDAIDDLLIGARRADPGGRSSSGISYIVFGRAPAAH